MAQVTIPLAYPPGVVSDDTAFAASGRTASANYVRWYQGKPETIGERVIISPSTDDRPVRGLFIRNTGAPGFLSRRPCSPTSATLPIVTTSE